MGCGACLRQEPDATLAELRTWLAAIGGPAVNQSTLWRAERDAGGGPDANRAASRPDRERSGQWRSLCRLSEPSARAHSGAGRRSRTR